MTEPKGMKLDAYLSRAGYGSRREAMKLIAAGRIRIFGEVVTNPVTEVIPGTTHVKVDDKLIKRLWPLTYIALNKPLQMITATKDDREREVVYSLLGKYKNVVQAVGRLDYDTEGLLLFTNDGELAHALTSPQSHVFKTYEVKIKGHVSPDNLGKLRNGIDIGGYVTLPAKVKVLKHLEANTRLLVTLHEGKYRQIRRMCDAIDHQVLRLRRIAFGPVELSRLAPGKFRFLEEWEIRKLRDLVKR